MIHFKNMCFFDTRNTIGTGIKSSSKNYNSVKSFIDRIAEAVIDKTCSAQKISHYTRELSFSF